MLCIGYKKVSFKAQDGSDILGYNIYLTEELVGNNCIGQSCEKIFISSNKLNKLGLDVNSIYGSTVRVLYNRYGKIEELELQ